LKEAKERNKTWEEIKAEAKNRVRWEILVEALCSAAELRDAIYISRRDHHHHHHYHHHHHHHQGIWTVVKYVSESSKLDVFVLM
jgi:hypothetical protein